MTTKRVVVPVENITFSAFDLNPVMLYNHTRGNVIGKWQNRRIEDGKLLADSVFDDADPEAKKISNKVEGGFIKGASIGIRNIVAEERFDDGGEAFFYVVSCDLREASVVDIPSDMDALTLYDANDKVVDLKEADFSDIFQTKKFVKQMDKKKIAHAIGLSDDVSDDALQGAIEAAFADSKKLKALQVETVAKNKAKAVELVDAAVSAGRLPNESKATFIELSDANFDLFEKTINALPTPMKLSDIGKKNVPGDVAIDRKDWNFTDWSKKDPSGLGKMTEEDRAKLCEAEFGF